MEEGHLHLIGYNVSADYLLGLTDDPRPLRPCGGTSPHRGGWDEGNKAPL